MPQLAPKPARFKDGQPYISPDDLNAIIDGQTRQLRGANGISVNYYGDRAVIRLTNSHQPTLPDVRSYMRQFVVLQEFDDWMLCAPFIYPVLPGSAQKVTLPYNPKLGKDAILVCYVAKPYVLQKTPWDKQTITTFQQATKITYSGFDRRVLTDSHKNTCNQLVAPPYYLGEVITALLTPTGYSTQQGYPGGYYGVPIEWQDANLAARAWAVESTNGDQTYLKQYPVVQTTVGIIYVNVNFATPNAAGYYPGTLDTYAAGVWTTGAAVSVKNLEGRALASGHRVAAFAAGLDGTTPAYLTEAGGFTGSRTRVSSVFCTPATQTTAAYFTVISYDETLVNGIVITSV